MNLIKMLATLDENEELHMARLLVLLNAFAGSQGTGTIDGLTKLAKLDFLLRYPVFLERALEAKHRKSEDAQVADHERFSIESRMIRYRYGPWDHRYRRFINMLVARGLAEVTVAGRTVRVGLTTKGKEVAERIASDENFKDIARRSSVLKRDFNVQGTNLMRFVYETFPEITTLRLGEEIK